MKCELCDNDATSDISEIHAKPAGATEVKRHFCDEHILHYLKDCRDDEDKDGQQNPEIGDDPVVY